MANPISTTPGYVGALVNGQVKSSALADREPFCCNEQCEFHEPKMRRNEGDRLRLRGGGEVLRHRISGRFFCDCCARAIELASGVGEVPRG